MKKFVNKYTIFVIVAVVALVLIVTSSSYAAFSRVATQKKANVISTISCVDVEFISENKSISLDAAYPMTDEEGMATIPFNFKLANKCKNYVEYELMASIIENNNRVQDNFVKIALNGSAIVPPITINNLKTIETPEALSKVKIAKTYKLADGVFNNKETTSYSFRMWLDGDNPAVWADDTLSGKNYTVKLSIVGVVKSNPSTTTK